MELAGRKPCQRTWDSLGEGLPVSEQGGSTGMLKMRLRGRVRVTVAGGRERVGRRTHRHNYFAYSDNTGQPHNAFRIINDDLSFILEAYEAYNPVFLSTPSPSQGSHFRRHRHTHPHLPPLLQTYLDLRPSFTLITI
jgi:hypothetical protein